MKILLSAALAAGAFVALASVNTASAQLYFPDGQPGYSDGQQEYGQDDYPQRGWRRHREQRYERPYYQPRARVGYTCGTRRGSCELGDGQALGSICRCYIPGFGPKRGYTQP